LLLEDSGGAAELGWPGGSQVAGVDLGAGAPHLYVGDQLGRHMSVALACPGRRLSRGVDADVVGELADQSGSGVQVWSPGRVGGDAVGNARQPQQRPPGGDQANVFDPGVDDSGLIMGARQVPLCGGGEEFRDRVGAGCGEKQ
jgi:hypothetical protein